ncbi:hypothetical protein [Bradyrhizobium sp.]|uniref:hypothetical protein n=1 Tax=Bradyrhizobium sp. TaxID=376 RepID=UPI0040384A51
MNRGTKGVLLVGGLAVAMVATYVGLSVAFARAVDPNRYCESGFSPLVGCTYHWSSTSTGQGTPIFTIPSSSTSTPSSSRHPFRTVEVTTWAVADCPQNYIARRLLCAVPSGATTAQAASDDLATGLPRPKPWVLTTGKKTSFIEAIHVETPLDLAGTLRFYRGELGKRGWMEDGGAVVEPDRAVITFTTSAGPALLRLTHQHDRTTADLSLRKRAAATSADILPKPGQVRLMLGNATDEEAVITINERTIKLAARAGSEFIDYPEAGRKSPDSPEIDLLPGKYKVALKVASGAAQNREFEVAADETWGLLVGPAGVPLPVHLY